MAAKLMYHFIKNLIESKLAAYLEDTTGVGQKSDHSELIQLEASVEELILVPLGPGAIPVDHGVKDFATLNPATTVPPVQEVPGAGEGKDV